MAPVIRWLEGVSRRAAGSALSDARVVKRPLALVGGLALALSCGGKSQRVTTSRCGPARDLGAEKLEVQRALCEREVRCGLYADLATCERVTFGRDLLGDGESGCARYHPERLPGCLELLRDAGCGFSALALAVDGCRPLFEGRLGVGEACASDAECERGACVDAPCGAACCTNRCAGRDAPVGAPCRYREDCVAGAFCEDGACAPLRQAGGLCLTGGADTCVRPLWCIAGVCTVPPRVDEACNRSAFFTSCDDLRDFCDDVTLKCVRVAPVGEPCTAEGRGCMAESECRDGRCVPLPELGGECEDGRCLGELFCNEDARCTVPVDHPEPASEPAPSECAEPSPKTRGAKRK